LLWHSACPLACICSTSLGKYSPWLLRRPSCPPLSMSGGPWRASSSPSILPCCTRCVHTPCGCQNSHLLCPAAPLCVHKSLKKIQIFHKFCPAAPGAYRPCGSQISGPFSPAVPGAFNSCRWHLSCLSCPAVPGSTPGLVSCYNS
jgi:hypothetical protein